MRIVSAASTTTSVESVVSYERGGRGGDSGLIARLDERTTAQGKTIAELENRLDDLRAELETQKAQLQRLVIWGSVIFAAVGLFGPTAINLIFHFGTK